MSTRYCYFFQLVHFSFSCPVILNKGKGGGSRLWFALAQTGKQPVRVANRGRSAYLFPSRGAGDSQPGSAHSVQRQLWRLGGFYGALQILIKIHIQLQKPHVFFFTWNNGV